MDVSNTINHRFQKTFWRGRDSYAPLCLSFSSYSRSKSQTFGTFALTGTTSSFFDFVTPESIFVHSPKFDVIQSLQRYFSTSRMIN